LASTTIAETVNTGGYDWLIPIDAVPGQYLIDVSYIKKDGSVGATDRSDAAFEVVK